MNNRSKGRDRRLQSATVIALAAMFVALIALVFSMGGPAGAKGKQLLTIATGSLTTSDGGPLELTNASFTQKAGDTILAVIKLDWDGEPPPFEGDTPCRFAGGVEITGAFFVELELTNGGFSPPPAVHGIVPSSADVERTIVSSVNADCPTDGVTVNLRVAVLAVG